MEIERPKGGARVNRRQFLSRTARTACGVGIFGLALGLLARNAQSKPTFALRPPGAGDEEDFVGACVRCGLCVRDCPFDILRLADLGDDPALGTPYFLARDIPCVMCSHIPCVAACPTGALDPELTDIADARMGLAVFVHVETCVNLTERRYCNVCYRNCPDGADAITMELQNNPPVPWKGIYLPKIDAQKCTGCGKCEWSCILDKSAIVVLPLDAPEATP